MILVDLRCSLLSAEGIHFYDNGQGIHVQNYEKDSFNAPTLCVQVFLVSLYVVYECKSWDNFCVILVSILVQIVTIVQSYSYVCVIVVIRFNMWLTR